jgi:hypothetical protein
LSFLQSARNTISESQERTVICDIVAKQTLTSDEKAEWRVDKLFIRIHAPMVLNGVPGFEDQVWRKDVLQETFQSSSK